jgi:hypothetical protein
MHQRNEKEQATTGDVAATTPALITIYNTIYIHIPRHDESDSANKQQ